MRKLCLLLLLVSSPAFAAYVEHYVSASGTDTWANSTNSGTPCSLATALANCSAGERANIKSDGAYSIAGGTVVNAGSASQLAAFRGYDTTIGDLDDQGRNADGSLDTTGFPEITTSDIIELNANVIMSSVKVTSTATLAYMVGSTTLDSITVVNCEFTFTGTGSTQCFRGDDSITVINCDFSSSGANHGALFNSDRYALVVGCRFSGTNNTSYALFNNGTVHESVFIGDGDGTGVEIENDVTRTFVSQSTFYNLDTAIALPNMAMTTLLITSNLHATDNSVFIDNQYSATSNAAVIEVHNRTRDNTTPRIGVGDGLVMGEITTDTGGPSTDYVDSGANNLRLISGAPGESAGLIDYSDVGAFQREASGGGSTTVIIIED